MTSFPAGRVVVVGAGPAGLTLACELALAGVPCRVLERRRCRGGPAGAVGLHARTLELFDLRGQAQRFAAVGRQVSRIRLTCGGLFDLGAARSRFPHLSVMGHCTAEEILAARAAELGVEIVRDAELVGLDQDDRGVTARVRGAGLEWRERASYLVGCDGENSTVRRLLQIPFEGSAYRFGAVQAEVRLCRPPDDDLALHLGRATVLFSVAGGDGWHRITCVDTARPWVAQQPTLDELRDVLYQAAGRDLQPQAPRWLRRFRLHRRLVARYRAGRVLLAGDAAHLHSPVGGHGVNLGVEDAVNLGWKLAAVLHGWAPPWLLDSYEGERRPVAKKVQRSAHQATLLLAGPGPARPGPRDGDGRAEQAGAVPVQSMVDAHRSGADTRYGCGGGPLAGRPAPDVELVGPDGRQVRLRELLHHGRFLMLDLTPDTTPARITRSWSGRVWPAVVDAADPERLAGITAMIIRPDGYVAWSTRATAGAVRARLCREALAHWCGPGQDWPAPSPCHGRSRGHQAGTARR